MFATFVADIMERDAPSIALEATVEDVVAHGRWIGLVTRADVLAALSVAEA